MANRIWMLLAIVFAGTTLALAVNQWRASTGEANPATPAYPASLKPGSNEMLRTKLQSVPGIEVIVSDVIIPPDATVPRHYHPGEEVAYVIEGSAVHVEEGKPDLPATAGDAFVIPPEAVHAPRGGPEGARAIVFRVHVAGQPERIPVPLDE